MSRCKVLLNTGKTVRLPEVLAERLAKRGKGEIIGNGFDLGKDKADDFEQEQFAGVSQVVEENEVEFDAPAVEVPDDMEVQADADQGEVSDSIKEAGGEDSDTEGIEKEAEEVEAVDVSKLRKAELLDLASERGIEVPNPVTVAELRELLG